MPTAPAERAKASFERLRKRLGELDDGGLARVSKLDAEVAAILAPAWTTARGVAERGFVAPSDLPPLFARRFVANDGSRLALYAIPAGEFWNDEVAMRFGDDVRRVDPNASGLALSHVEHGNMIMLGFERAAAIAAAVVLLILIADFRSIKDALLALLPTAIGWLWMLGLMAMLGLRFDVANIVALPLVIGVGIAYGVHLMHRVREGESDTDTSGVRGRAHIDDAIRGTGGAIMVAALTTVVGFAALTISDYGAMKSLGWVMCIGITTCLLATILVLPAVLVMIRRAQRSGPKGREDKWVRSRMRPDPGAAKMSGLSRRVSGARASWCGGPAPSSWACGSSAAARRAGRCSQGRPSSSWP
jgi:uncharacterized protein